MNIMVNNFIRKFISKKLFIKSSEIIIKETIENDSSCEVIFICKYGGSLTSQSLSIDRIELNNFINELRNEIKAQAKKIGATPVMVESTV